MKRDYNKEIIDKGIELNNEIVMKDKDRKDPKKVIAALHGEITKKNKRILRLENTINDMADKIDEKATIIQDMNRFYSKRNIFQRIFNKYYGK
jgi:predicted  nucleic acid-binding Zn-ribbon protein